MPKQFDVCRLKNGRDQLVVVLQNNVAQDLDTRIVAPLSNEPFRRLIQGIRVPVNFGDEPKVLQVDRMAAIHRSAIGVVVGSVAADEHRIKNALDLVFFGV